MKTKYPHFICMLTTVVAMAAACSKGDTPTVYQPTVEDMTATTVTVKGLIFAEGGSPVIRAGVCYAVQSSPDNKDTYYYEYPSVGGAGVTAVESETKVGTLKIKLTGLKMDTMYFARIFAENDAGTSYSYPVRFRIDGARFADSEIKFETATSNSYLPYHFKSSTVRTDRISFGKKANDGMSGSGTVEVDPAALTAYNQANGTSIEMLPASVYSLTSTSWTFTGTTNYQDLIVAVNRNIDLPDGKVYGLPLKLVIDGSDKTSTTVVLYHVDDLSGWYTVDRLPHCGEGADKYPLDPAKRRRYVKRTSATTWKTGYLFRCYVEDENDENKPDSPENAQFITVDPATKKISILQGIYDVTTELNAFDPNKEELHIEYLYLEWEGWWTAERMYNRTGRKM